MADDRCDLLCLDLPRAEEIRKNRLDPDRAQQLAARAAGLADPTRLMLAAALLEAGELCVCDLSWISGRAANLVSHHLRALRNQGLVHSRREGKLVIYALSEVGIRLAEAVLASPAGRGGLPKDTDAVEAVP